MNPITQAELQTLVSLLPEDKLARAYRLLSSLFEPQREPMSPSAFLQLSAEEQRRQLAEQAAEMQLYYEETQNDRQEWQSEAFADED